MDGLGVKRVLAGKTPQASIAPDQLHTFGHLPDTARECTTRDRTFGP